jgi:hypothetical protein
LRNALIQKSAFSLELSKFFPQNEYFLTFWPTQFFLTALLFQAFTEFLQGRDYFIHGSSTSIEYY